MPEIAVQTKKKRMEITELLIEKKSTILSQWIKEIVDTYPADSSRFLSKGTDRITNPLGYSIAQGLTSLYDVLCQEKNVQESGDAMAALEQLVKIRAVQEFAPSEAVGFIYGLKNLLVKEYSRQGNPDLQAWQAFTDRIDRIALQVFDMYMSNRERLHQIRVRELQSGTSQLTDGSKCFAAAMRRNKEQKPELKTITGC